MSGNINGLQRGCLLFTLLFFIRLSPIFGQIPAGDYFWLRSDRGIVFDGENVRSWKDESNGILFTQPDSNHYPKYVKDAIGIYPIIRFGGYQYLDGPNIFPSNHDYTISVVITINDTSAYNNILSGDHHGFWLNQNTYPAVVHSDHFQTHAVSTIPIRNGPNILTVRFSEATQQAVLYVNGLFGDSMFVDINLDSSICIGSYQHNYSLRGDIAELIMYNRECTDTERRQIEDYLFTKYNLSHPPPLPLPDSTFSELPRNLQFYPRDNNDSALVPINGSIYRSGFDSIYCIEQKNKVPFIRYSLPLYYKNGKASFSFLPSIHSELSEYSFTIGVKSPNNDSILAISDSIICGDVYLISGQSNAIFGYGDSLFAGTNEFCRTFGMNYSHNVRDTQWALSIATYWGDINSVSGWGLRFQKRIAEDQKIPTCIVDGALSGNIIEHFEKNRNYSFDLNTTYGRTLYRLTKSKLANSVKAIFWIHGELYDSINLYYSQFKDIYDNWRTDYPSVRKIYLGQLRPSYCANIPIVKLRDLQRSIEDSLPIIETFALAGLPYQDGCHFHDSGWVAFGDQVYNLLANDFYSLKDTVGIHSPHIRKAFYSSPSQDEIRLIFSPLEGGLRITSDTIVYGISASLKDYFYFDDSLVNVQSLSISKDTLLLKLNEPTNSSIISYLPELYYKNSVVTYEGPWLESSRGVGALIFWHFPIDSWKNDTNVPLNPMPITLEALPDYVHNRTELQFTLPSEQFINLSIFNDLGNKVSELLNGNIYEGIHDVLFDTSKLPTGEYFCRLLTTNGTLTKKIIVAN